MREPQSEAKETPNSTLPYLPVLGPQRKLLPSPPFHFWGGGDLQEVRHMECV